MSPITSRLPTSPPVAAAIASSRRSVPPRTSPPASTAYPTRARAAASRSRSPAVRAIACASSADRRISPGSATRSARVSASQPCSADAGASRSRPCARAYQPLLAAVLPWTAWYSRDSHSAERAACDAPPRSRNPVYARSMCTIAASGSCDHQSARASPSSASGDGSWRIADSNATRARSHSPVASASTASWRAAVGSVDMAAHHRTALVSLERGPDDGRSGAHRVPHCLELDEGRDLVRALGLVVERVGRRRVVDTLDVLSGELLDLGAEFVRHTGGVDRVHVHVPGEPRHELLGEAGEHVDD